MAMKILIYLKNNRTSLVSFEMQIIEDGPKKCEFLAPQYSLHWSPIADGSMLKY